MRAVRTVLSEAAYHAIRAAGDAPESLRVLMYHRVTDAHPSDRLCVPVAKFADQLRHLYEHGYRTATLAEAVTWVQGLTTMAPRTVVLTFDDGFEDNALYAAPALARYGFTGCFFLPTAFIEAGQTARLRPEDRPMSWAQAGHLLEGGHDIGAHSVTHRKLGMLPIEDARREIAESKAVLEARLSRPVTWFCYPAGDYTPAVRQAVASSGYAGACTVRPGANRPGMDPFALRRTEISAFDSPRDFEKKLAGAYDWLHHGTQWTQRTFLPKRQCANAQVPL